MKNNNNNNNQKNQTLDRLRLLQFGRTLVVKMRNTSVISGYLENS